MRNKLSTVLVFGSMLGLAAPLFAQGNAKTPNPSKSDLFSQADTNGDGKISRDEFLNFERTRAEQRFDRHDANKDGFIEKSEWAQAKKKMKERKGARQSGATEGGGENR